MTYLVHFTFADRKKLRVFISNSKFCIEWGSLSHSRCTYLHGSELISNDQLRMGSANWGTICHFLLRSVEGAEIICCANTEEGQQVYGESLAEYVQASWSGGITSDRMKSCLLKLFNENSLWNLTLSGKKNNQLSHVLVFRWENNLPYNLQDRISDARFL